MSRTEHARLLDTLEAQLFEVKGRIARAHGQAKQGPSTPKTRADLLEAFFGGWELQDEQMVD